MEKFEYRAVHVPASKHKQSAALSKYGADGWELVGPVRVILGAGRGTAQMRRLLVHQDSDTQTLIVGFLQRATAAIDRANHRMEKRIAEQNIEQATRKAAAKAAKAARKTGTAA